MNQISYLVRPEHIPDKAAFPVIDAHNHLWGDYDVPRIIEVMDAVGLAAYADLTANLHLSFGGGGYTVSPAPIEDFFDNCAALAPGRFYAFTMSQFARSADQPLFDDASRFVSQTIETLNRHVALGACGLKILKELGLRHRDAQGNLIAINDPRLAPIWDEAARLALPILVHQSDPCGLFEPITPENEHYQTLTDFPQWSFAGKEFPSKSQLLANRDELLERHRRTTFILPHVANYPENLEYVSRLLDDHPNVYIDFSARIDELGRQPYRSRDFILRHQDRIVFGTDMPASTEMYRCYFRFLETFDEYFFAPYYDGTFGKARWPIYGLGLPRPVLRKIYHQNILKIIPKLHNILTMPPDPKE